MAGSQNAAEMAECLLVIQHNRRGCGHTCVCALSVGGCLCVSVIKLDFKNGFLYFLHVFAHICVWDLFVCVFSV